MKVQKRDGRTQPVQYDKITTRLQQLMWGLDKRFVFPEVITQYVTSSIRSGIRTTEIDELAAQSAGSLATRHPDYTILAGRILVSNLHKETPSCFSEAMEIIHRQEKEWNRGTSPISPRSSSPPPQEEEGTHFAPAFMAFVRKHRAVLDGAIEHQRDYDFDYFAMCTLQKSYLMGLPHNHIIERPQYMFMRVAVALNLDHLGNALRVYRMLSQKRAIFASPTLFNAGKKVSQLSSCFLLQMQADSIKGIYHTLSECAAISQHAGGIGVAISKIRASGSVIRTSGGRSDGIVPMLKVYEMTAAYVDQGGGKRKGSFAMYLEPWHADIYSFLDLRKPGGNGKDRTFGLFTALWIPDLFMKRVEEDKDWSLFCPDEAPGLHEVWGDEFDTRYQQYEQEGRARTQVKARALWFSILESERFTGTPYILYKDTANRMSNHQHLGTIQCSNLCAEIIEYTAPDEIAVCNLGSLSLPAFVNGQEQSYDFDGLVETTRYMIQNLNRVIDVNYYPVADAERSNKRHRPIGLGVQGLADVFLMMGYSFESPEARRLNLEIFEAIYYGAVRASVDLARKDNCTYDTYEGSFLSRGVFHFDLYGVQPSTDRHDWVGLRRDLKQYGIRNSLLIALMPTASTAHILGNNECIEPFTHNVYVRRVLSGEFTVFNPHLLKEMVARGLWTPETVNRLIAASGSVQYVHEFPEDMKERFKTAWEISAKTLVDLAADRAPFVDQSQSLNIFMPNPTFKRLSSMHFYGWKRGLKTGTYYLRRPVAAEPIKFTVDPSIVSEAQNAQQQHQQQAKKNSVSALNVGLVCKREDGCVSCQG